MKDEESNGIKMIEFFSGIGGMRFGLQDAIQCHNSSISANTSRSDGDRSCIGNENGGDGDGDGDGSECISNAKNVEAGKSSLISCTAYEISLHANQTYSLNFNEPISSFKSDHENRKKDYDHQSKHSRGTCTLSNGSISSSFDHPKETKKTKRKNFKIYTKLIEQLKSKDVSGVDLWTMSPPCQPFTNTRHAKQLDSTDERCKGFKAIINLLQELNGSDNDSEDSCANDNDMQYFGPKWILVENVKGFFGSDMLSQWYKCLNECDYTWEEYLLSPTQFGIPNNRTRYYMVAERSNRFSNSSDSHQPTNIKTNIPPINYPSEDFITSATVVKPLSNYIQQFSDDDGKEQQYIIPDHVFDKEWAKDLPIVCELDNITHCFTAGYGRQIHRATGSLLLIANGNERSHPVAEDPIDRTDMSAYKGKLRRFTENELLGLFGFPSSFQFPKNLSLDHRYKLIGNSVNVKVISSLLRYLLFQPSTDSCL